MMNAPTSPTPTSADSYAALRVIKRALTQSATTDFDFPELFGELEQVIDAASDLMEVHRATRMVLSLFKAFPMLDVLRSRGMDPDKYEYCQEFELARALKASPKCTSDLCFFANRAQIYGWHSDLDVTVPDFFPTAMSFLIEKLDMHHLKESEPLARSPRPVIDPG